MEHYYDWLDEQTKIEWEVLVKVDQKITLILKMIHPVGYAADFDRACAIDAFGLDTVEEIERLAYQDWIDSWDDWGYDSDILDAL